MRLHKGASREVLSPGHFLSFTDDLNAGEELTQIVKVGLPDLVVRIGDVFLSATINSGEGALEVCLLDQGARLLDHDHAIVDQIAHIDKGFAL